MIAQIAILLALCVLAALSLSAVILGLAKAAGLVYFRLRRVSVTANDLQMEVTHFVAVFPVEGEWIPVPYVINITTKRSTTSILVCGDKKRPISKREIEEGLSDRTFMFLPRPAIISHESRLWLNSSMELLVANDTNPMADKQARVIFSSPAVVSRTSSELATEIAAGITAQIEAAFNAVRETMSNQIIERNVERLQESKRISAYISESDVERDELVKYSVE